MKIFQYSWCYKNKNKKLTIANSHFICRKKKTRKTRIGKNMQKTHKRKQQSSQSRTTKSAKRAKSIIDKSKGEPYPDHLRPTPEECRAVRDTLLANHGFPKEFIKYRQQRMLVNHSENGEKNVVFGSSVDSVALDDGEEPKESVLDGLVSTILSQNTTDLNSQRAFASLKSVFPTWEEVSFFFVFVIFRKGTCLLLCFFNVKAAITVFH